MRTIILKRIISGVYGTFGILLEDNVPFMATLEEPWKENKKNISCIPTGTYVCTREHSHKFGETFMVNEVLNRTGILFHAGNTIGDTEGCILVGKYHGAVAGSYGVLVSRPAFTDFMERLKDEHEFKLVIV